jgi:carbonic anhydrase
MSALIPMPTGCALIRARRPAALRMLAMCLGLSVGMPVTVSASEDHPSKVASVAPAVSAAAPATTDATVVEPINAKDRKKPKILERVSAIEARGPRDPMDMLRERLAQKLGATHAPDSANPNVLRVVSKPSTVGVVASESPGTMTLAPAPARVVHRKIEAAEPAHVGAGPAHWDYTGSGGPETWGQMKPEFAKCSTGLRQSPIDIRDGIKVELDAVQFDYKPSAFSVIDNGHTVQVNVKPGNSIEVMGRRYELVQFHFHRPSEERIDGKQFDMVVHLVHKDLDGRLAVVAVLLERGSAQTVVQNVWNNLPLEKGDELAARAPMNLNDLLPTERTYFTYMGSLTTPPCSEGVLWMVMKKPVQISPEQIGIFARLYPMNSRPIQSASGRLIKESN